MEIALLSCLMSLMAFSQATFPPFGFPGLGPIPHFPGYFGGPAPMIGIGSSFRTPAISHVSSVIPHGTGSAILSPLSSAVIGPGSGSYVYGPIMSGVAPVVSVGGATAMGGDTVIMGLSPTTAGVSVSLPMGISAPAVVQVGGQAVSGSDIMSPMAITGGGTTVVGPVVTTGGLSGPGRFGSGLAPGVFDGSSVPALRSEVPSNGIGADGSAVFHNRGMTGSEFAPEIRLGNVNGVLNRASGIGAVDQMNSAGRLNGGSSTFNTLNSVGLFNGDRSTFNTMNAGRSTFNAMNSGGVLNGGRSTFNAMNSGGVLNGGRSTLNAMNSGGVLNGGRSTFNTMNSGGLLNGGGSLNSITYNYNGNRGVPVRNSILPSVSAIAAGSSVISTGNSGAAIVATPNYYLSGNRLTETNLGGNALSEYIPSGSDFMNSVGVDLASGSPQQLAGLNMAGSGALSDGLIDVGGTNVGLSVGDISVSGISDFTSQTTGPGAAVDISIGSSPLNAGGVGVMIDGNIESFGTNAISGQSIGLDTYSNLRNAGPLQEIGVDISASVPNVINGGTPGKPIMADTVPPAVH